VDDFFDLWWEILPYIIISIALNVIGARYARGKKVLHLPSNEFLSIIIAALVGLASPLPTYAAIPIALSLMTTGLPFSAVMAFVLSSPLMNPTIFFLTATQISLGMAIARTVSAFLLALIGGLLTSKVFTRIYQELPALGIPRKPSNKSLVQDIVGTSKYILKYFSFALLLSSAVRAVFGKDTKLHFHSLRHSFCSNLIRNGADIKVVQSLAGHSSLVVTEKYTHYVRSDAVKAVHLLESVNPLGRLVGLE